MAGEPDADADGDAEPNAATTPGSRPPPDVLELDPTYEALGHSRRRYLCYTLFEDAAWSLTDLATKVAAWESDVPEHEVSADDREAVYVSLYHVHVPKLVDVGVIEFDETDETITKGSTAGRVLAALEGVGASLDADQEAHARGETDAED
jgi:hypothetical protein